MKILSNFFSMIGSLIEKILSVFELFLFIRLLLNFLAANPGNFIVRAIYDYSSIFISPFNSIFHDIYWKGHLIEISTVLAMVAYAIAVQIVLILINSLSNE
ncbi:MAG: YggT family protein [Candidatus Pacebacteria bacterium]|nr:YggT family protein [Candidatus Paceibacterota bacterium]